MTDSSQSAEQKTREAKSLSEVLERLKKELSFGLALLSVRSRELWDSRELATEIRKLRRVRRQRVEELGEATHRLLQEGKLEELSELEKLSGRVREVEKEIEEKEAELAEVRHRAEETLARAAQWERKGDICRCGAAWIPGARYCHLCGKPLPPSESTEAKRTAEPPPLPVNQEIQRRAEPAQEDTSSSPLGTLPPGGEPPGETSE
ncbi:hypothetical protein [Candidatus Methylacidithermus pantelleriae]|uniref:Exonuclease SbcC n=1 Tax=Candidatus Methylacidithermus pantelleriae TaxID=2744239 RepID=A0A8J2FQ47_9BACT|nr:hypothetical protein [Candidatus Methylacidithermus pantelleriae]CAF0697978.1 Exonuclease SbcC [Candidatus Methylacidithermus pantelleriae]